MREIPALGPDGPCRTRRSATLTDSAGHEVAELAQAPALMVSHWISRLRDTAPLPASEVIGVLAKAADVFADQEIMGDDLARHERRVAELTGTPVTVVRECDRLILDALRHPGRAPAQARPTGCTVEDVGTAPVAQGAVWVPRGEVFAVHAAGNSPGVHAMWLEALTLGYRVVVRPSQRDPLTPGRLVTALRTAGLPADQVLVAPCDHSTADQIIDRADLALVYGGQDVADSYGGRDDVRLQGPGRSKLLVTSDADRGQGLALAREGALYHAGTACTATTAVLVERDAPRFAADLAAELDGLPAAGPADEDAALPCMPVERAGQLVAAVTRWAQGSIVHLAPRVERVGRNGTQATVTPAVVEVASADSPLLAHEMPFPCVWVAPWDDGDLAALDDSLVLSLHTTHPELATRAARLGRVANVYHGRPTSWTHPDVPHDGYLGTFLMRAKGLALAP